MPPAVLRPRVRLLEGLIELPSRMALLPAELDIPEDYILPYARVQDDKLTRQASAFQGLNIGANATGAA